MWKNRLILSTGTAILFQGCLALIPFFAATITRNEGAANSFLVCFIIALVIGGGLTAGFRGTTPIRTIRLTVLMPLTLLLAVAFISAIPFYLYWPEDGLLAAFFEGVSFITTSGVSAYYNDPSLTSFTLWRNLLAWEGGFLATAYALSLAASLNSGGARLHARAMEQGDSREDYLNLFNIAKRLLPYYLGMSFFFFLILFLGGYQFFHALQLGTALIATSAFPGAEKILSGHGLTIVTVLLFISCLNPDMIYAALHGKFRKIVHDPETKSLLMVIAGSFMLLLLTHLSFDSFSFTESLFLVVSSLSTFAVVPAEITGHFQASSFGFVVLFLVFCGGGITSATGGMKQLRLIALIRLCQQELQRLAHPHRRSPLKIGALKIHKKEAETIWLLVGGFTLTLAVGTLSLAIGGLDFDQAVALAISGLTLSGPSAFLISTGAPSFSALTSLEYSTLIILMLIGRLEITVFLALIAKRFWKG